ncbi:MAG: hypothetical protein M3Z85_06160, partial [Acidobacteriota bacterium]|nr:hypothetical protein [Acidobacteriota bacterium]
AWQLLEFANVSSRVVKYSVFAGCCYALFFSFCGIAINELNGPQFRYFARRIDGREYLREALPAYRALEFVNTQLIPGDAVLFVDACSAAYLADSTEFACYAVDERTGWGGAKAKIAGSSYRFAVVPRVFAGDAPSGWTQKYADETFSVLSLSKR